MLWPILLALYGIAGASYCVLLVTNVYYFEEKDGLNVVDFIWLAFFLPFSIVTAVITGIVVSIAFLFRKLKEYKPDDIVNLRK